MKTSAYDEMIPSWIQSFMKSAMQQQAQFDPQPNGDGPPELTVDLEKIEALRQDYTRQLSSLWEDVLSSKPLSVDDPRFSGPEWSADPLARISAASYLLHSRFMLSMVDVMRTSPKIKERIRFAVQQTIDAMSPANLLASNPVAQKKIMDTGGRSLANGISNMLRDLQKGRVTQTDEDAFDVGKNVATTEGAVIYENELMQLIQYKPLTKTVYERPLLIVPPCINKYYILDLQPENSLIRFALENGHSVFLISWRNPDASTSQIGWDDYIEDALIRAIEIVQAVSGQEQVNALGFCIGGTLLATAAAVLNARNKKPLASLTLLTTLLDFSDTGSIGVFVDEAQVAWREQTIGQGGLMPARDFASVFSCLRPNDLIWNYYQSNYLKGEDPTAFDLLYWNSDSTNLPGPAFCWYLRNTYLENSLSVPAKLTVAGEKLNLSNIDVPAFIYGSREDHLVPWQSAYRSLEILNAGNPGANRFVLGASGHIAGVINPPSKKKRSYWLNNLPCPSAQEWLDGAEENPGSWWPEWERFLSAHAGKKRSASPQYGNRQYKVIEPAPGRYVKVRAE